MAKRRKRTNKNVPAKGRLRDIVDRLWSRAVLSDWAWKCAVCGKKATDAHHLVPRQHEATRYELMNGIGLCQWDHVWNPDTSPHVNAAGWLEWLVVHYGERHDWYMGNTPPPRFMGIKNAQHYIDAMESLRQYVEPEEFERIVGVRFSAWLEEHKE